MSFTDFLRELWNRTPVDVQAIALIAAVFPPAMMAFLLAPTQILSRIVFCLSMVAVTWLLTFLIDNERPTVACTFRTLSGFLFVGSLFVVHGTAGTDAIPWRIVAGTLQATLVAAWAATWWSERRWLAKTIARNLSIVAVGGLVLYIYVNFAVTDPLRPGEWGIPGVPRGLTGRTLAPVVEAALFVLAYVGWLSPLYRYHKRHGHL